MVENPFPYNMADDITDFIIWSVTWLGISRIKELIESRFSPDNFDIAIFEIPERDKTIVISHVHFLVRPRQSGDYFVFIKEKLL